RYLFGIMMPDLPRVEFVILWLEIGENLFKIPSRFLQDIHREMEKQGCARYSGKQWRINILLDETVLSPQGTRGKRRYSIDEYTVDLPNERHFDPRNFIYGY